MIVPCVLRKLERRDENGKVRLSRKGYTSISALSKI